MNKKEKNILIFIITAGFLLRIGGIFYAFPLAVISDETPTLLASLKMIGTHSLWAGGALQYYYPALLSYVYLPFLTVYLVLARFLGIFNDIQQIKDAVFFNLGFFIPVVRLISVFLGTASIYLVYRITDLLFKNKWLGLLAAWFLAISFFNVGNSHFAQTWTPQTFFILLVLFWSCLLYRKTNLSLKDYLISGLLVGAAFGINFIGIVSYFWILLVHVLKNKEKKLVNIFIKNKKLWSMNLFLFFIVAFIYYLNPYGLNNYLNRIFVRSPAPGYANFELLQLDTLTNLLVYIKNIFIVEPIFSIIFIFGSILLWKKNKKQFYFLVPWVIIYLLLLSALTGSMIRYALPVVPILIIVNAYFAYFIFSKTKKRVLGKTVLIFVISAYTLIFSILFDLRLTQIDTRVLARDWVLGNVPSGSVIKNFNLADELNLNENKENIKMIKENLPELFSTKRKYMLDLSADDYPKPSYFVVNYEQLEDLSPKFEYVIISSQERSFLYSETEKLEDNYVLVKYFYPTEDSAMQYGREYLGIPFNHSHFNPLALFKQFDYNGPFVEIYKLKNEGNQKQ